MTIASGPAAGAVGPPDPLMPARLGPVELRNRVIKAATYEGLSRRGLVTEELIAFHRRPAAGGVGMTTLAFCAVSPEGRTDPDQIVMRPEAVPGLRRLADAVHVEGAAVSAQLGHAGAVANATDRGATALSPSRSLRPMSLGFTRPASVEDVQRISRAHGDAARTALESGFDAVEVHLGHNYLASSFLSPRLNRRHDDYGGSLENRARFSREILRSVRDAVGDRLAVIAKLNMDDGVRGGFALAEAVDVARWIEGDGTVDALEMTAGSSLLNPMYLFKGDAPIDAFAAAMPQPIRAGVKLFGRRVFRTYPYTDAYLFDDARRIREAVRLPMVLLGGVTDKAVMDRAMAAGFQFVAMARALLREPDLVERIRRDDATRSACIHGNDCMPTIYSGTRCVLVEAETPRSAGWRSGDTTVGSV